MTSDAKRATSAAAAARAILLDASPCAGPLSPREPLSFDHLAHFGEFVGYDAREDIRIRAERIRAANGDADRPLSVRLRGALDRALADPNARTVRSLELAFEQFHRRGSLSEALEAACDALLRVTQFHRAAFGCPQASQACSAVALAMAADDFAVGRYGPGLRALKGGMVWAQDAFVDGRSTPYQPGPNFQRIVAFETLAGDWLPGFVACATAERMVADEDDILRAGAGQIAPAAPAAPVLPQHDDLCLGEDLDDILLRGTAAARQVAPPTLIVLAKGALDHLPGTPDSGKAGRPGHQSTNPRTQWEPWAGREVPLAHGVDVAAATATLVAEFPWAEAEIRAILADLVGARFTRLRPTLLLGKPGHGKTRLARRIGEVLGVPLTFFSCAGASDASFGGTNRQWSTGKSSTVGNAIQQGGVANPYFVMDEVDKIADGNHNGNLCNVLVNLFERESAARYFDPFVEAAMDLSATTFVCTANNAKLVPSVLLDRLRILTVPDPRAQDLPVVVAQLAAAYRDEQGLDEVWCPSPSPDEAALIARHWRGGSLRVLARLTWALLSGREHLATRN